MQNNSAPSARLDLSTETLVRTVWRGRLWLLRVVGLFAVAGIGMSLLLQAEFVSEATVMPEMSTGSGELRRLASVVGFGGVDLADTEDTDAIRPDLYPSVLQSTPFMLHLMGQPVTTTSGQRTTVAAILTDDGIIRWWQTLFSPKEIPYKQSVVIAGEPVKLAKREQELAEAIGKRVSARLDTRSGVIRISARMPDAHAAAAVAQLAMDYLTEYVTNYRTEKARQDLRFYSLSLNETRLRYQKAQMTVFRYNDQHKYAVIVMQAATMDKQRMDAELSIAQTVYAELSREFERAKLRVQERTPVFTVLEPAQVPLERVSPKRAVLVLLFMLVGLVMGVSWLIAKQNDVVGRMRMMIGKP